MKYFDYDAYIKQLEELVSIDSGSFDPEGVDKVAEAMARKYEELGLTVTKKRFDERAGYCLEVRNYPEEESIDILMVGHMDTVFPKGTVAKRPFTMDEKKAYGPGVDDMKSGLHVVNTRSIGFLFVHGKRSFCNCSLREDCIHVADH